MIKSFDNNLHAMNHKSNKNATFGSMILSISLYCLDANCQPKTN